MSVCDGAEVCSLALALLRAIENDSLQLWTEAMPFTAVLIGLEKEKLIHVTAAN